MLELKCVECSADMQGSHTNRLYCSPRCKSAHRKKTPTQSPDGGHSCRICGTWFAIGKGQHNKWLCSDKCRVASNTKSVRDFHKRNPDKEPIYRKRTKEKRLPDSNLVRFRRTNPHAPRACESCGEKRVLDVAHKPEHRRNGAWRSGQNCQWPDKVWVLCPTCHALLDRMHYAPSELGLE